MPNGKPGDHPITDMLMHGAHPFAIDIEMMVRKLNEVSPQALSEIWMEAVDWEQGRNTDAGYEKLKGLLKKCGAL